MQVAIFPSREVAVKLMDFEIRWYGVMYVLALAAAWGILRHLDRYRGLRFSSEERFEILTYAMAGVLLGGRLGYVMLYEPVFFWNNPGQVWAIWQGGMASHGGFIGVGIALAIWARGRGWDNYLKLLDIVSVPAALGLALGRVGNIINQELLVGWLSQGVGVGKNILLAGLCYWWLRRKSWPPGLVIGLFLCVYGLLRLIDEGLRMQAVDYYFGLTRGQWYTLLLIGLGWWLCWYVNSRHKLIRAG